ncbi:MAG: hypothetical protein MK212_22075, partial [Saprospiraceae bacterium]|nr:hypothetical protein [Saprospiraceae bacterium]
MKRDIAVLIPYYGRIPSFFNLFVESCRPLQKVDFIFFTDLKIDYNLPEHVKVIDIPMERVEQLFEEKIGVPIKIHKPYKLCDIRPMYGATFADYITEYKYWGYCDVDLVFAPTLDKLLETCVQEDYDVINTFD